MPTETATLLASLQSTRHHILGAVDGLTDDQLRGTPLPSGWAIIGLIHHLAIDVERFWFQAVMVGDQAAWQSFENSPASAWQLPDNLTPADVIELYRRESAMSDEIIRELPLDTEPTTWPTEMFGSFRLDNLRQMVLHVITETACHAGHLDAARELTDGEQWIVLG